MYISITFVYKYLYISITCVCMYVYIGKMVANVEDMAVDLYVMERAFISTHPGMEH